MDDDVRALRLKAGLSQQEVAIRAGCSIGSVRMFDQGYRPKQSEALARVLRVLGDASQAPQPPRASTTRLRAMREQRAMTQMELAHASGVSSGAIANAECGRVAPRPETFLKLAKALDCAVEELA